MYGCMDVWVYGCVGVYVYMCTCVHVYMCKCVCVCIYLHDQKCYSQLKHISELFAVIGTQHRRPVELFL